MDRQLLQLRVPADLPGNGPTRERREGFWSDQHRRHAAEEVGAKDASVPGTPLLNESEWVLGECQRLADAGESRAPGRLRRARRRGRGRHDAELPCRTTVLFPPRIRPPHLNEGDPY